MAQVSSPTSQLELRDVTVGFGGKCVLDHVNLRVETGESVVLVGPSGQGKTVLLKLLAGLHRPSRGTVLFEGEDLRAMSPARRTEVRLTMGMLFQKNALFDSWTAFDNIAFPLRQTTTLDEEQIRARAAHYLDLVGLGEARDRRPDELSGGMQKRLGIARALALKPRVVLYDDPTAGLDPITSRHVIDLILDLRRRDHATIVTVTNEMNRAYQLAERIVFVADGELIVTGTPAQTLDHPDPRVRQFVRGLTEGPLTSRPA